MPDNIQLNGVSIPGGAIARTKDRGAGVQLQLVGIDLNPAGGETLMSGTMPISGSVTVTSGSIAISSGSVTVASGTVTLSGTSAVGGNVAAGNADSGNPIKIGNKAVPMGANPTGFTTGNRTDAPANCHGIPFVQPGHPNVVCFRYITTQANTDLSIVTIAGGNKIVCTRISAKVSGTADVSFIVGFGLAATPTTTGVLLSNEEMGPRTKDGDGNGAGILGTGADGEDIRLTNSVPSNGALTINGSYYILPG